MFKVNNKDTKTRFEIFSKLTIKIPEQVVNMFKVNNKDTRTRCEIYSELRRKIPERCPWRQINNYLTH